jgi:hypothetical protein
MSVRAASTNDREVKEMMRVVAGGCEKLARQAEKRVREADKVWSIQTHMRHDRRRQ